MVMQVGVRCVLVKEEGDACSLGEWRQMTLGLLMDAVQQEERRQQQDVVKCFQSDQYDPCMRINWVKGEGPTLNQQLPGHQYQMKFSISGWELLTGAGYDPEENVKTCVGKWSQSKCSWWHAGSLQWRGDLKNHFYLPERERGPAC